MLDSLAKKHKSINGTYGTQTFYLGENRNIDLVDRGALMGFEIFPIEDGDEEKYEIITITGNHLWRPDEFAVEPSDTFVNTVATNTEFTDVDAITKEVISMDSKTIVGNNNIPVGTVRPSFDPSDTNKHKNPQVLHQYHPIKARKANVEFNPDFYLEFERDPLLVILILLGHKPLPPGIELSLMRLIHNFYNPILAIGQRNHS